MGDLGNGESQNQASKPIQISLGLANFRWNNLLPRFLRILMSALERVGYTGQRMAIPWKETPSRSLRSP